MTCEICGSNRDVIAIDLSGGTFDPAVLCARCRALIAEADAEIADRRRGIVRWGYVSGSKART